MKRVAILGDGGWGTALALLLHRNGHPVAVWSPFADYADEVRASRENLRYLPGFPLPPDLLWTAERGEAVDGAGVVVLAVPSEYLPGVASSFAGLLPAGARVLSVTKGLDRATRRCMSVVAGEALGAGPVAALSGPSFAEEVARGWPTAVVAACRDPGRAVEIQQVFNSEHFRVYTSDDVVGVELGGALKNVIALAAGVCDGLGLGNNIKAALMTRGLAEIARLGAALGARPATFAGLSGMGDLVLTCTGRLSRNRRFGERVGAGEPPDAVRAGMVQVAEGVVNSVNARALAREAGVDMPIVEEVCRVLFEGRSPREAVGALMAREPRPERG